MRILLFIILLSSFLLNVVLITEGSIFELKQRLTEKGGYDYKINRNEKIYKQKLFAVSPKTQERVSFWEKVYGEYDSGKSIIHDSKNLGLIYEVLDFSDLEKQKISKFKKERLREKEIYRSKVKIRNIILKLSKIDKQKSRQNIYLLSDYEREIYEKIKSTEGYSFRQAVRYVREQRGQKDKIIEAVIRSDKYIHAMKKIFIKHDIPQELVLLSFVESSFNINAASKAGAAGVWQIMPSVGKRFLNINKNIDERKDPIKSTHVAAIILSESYRKLRNWPLAITSYNVGWPTVLRITRKVKSKDLEDVILRRNSKTIGFASKNFYASFIAMLNVCSSYKHDFFDMEGKKPIMFKTMVVKHSARLRDILFGANVTVSKFKEFNPEFKKPILLSHAKIPRGTKIKFPKQKY